MNLWDYLNASPWGAALLVFLVGWTLVRLVRAVRDRRPVRVRLVLVCPVCGDEVEGHHQGMPS